MLEKQEGWGQLNVNYVGNKSIINTFFNSLSKKLKGPYVGWFKTEVFKLFNQNLQCKKK